MNELIQNLCDVISSVIAPDISLDLHHYHNLVQEIVTNDFQFGDYWLLIIDKRSVNLVLVKMSIVKLIQSKDSESFECFLVCFTNEGYSLDKINPQNSIALVNAAKVNRFRKPSRQLAFEHLNKVAPQLLDTEIFEKWSVGQALFIQIDNNSLTYFIGKSSIVGGMPLPLSVDRPTGCYKLNYINKFGHAELKSVSRSMYQKAMKNRISA